MFLRNMLMSQGSAVVTPAVPTFAATTANTGVGQSESFTTASKSGATWSGIFSGGFTFFVWFKASSFTDFNKIMTCADSGLTMDVSIDVKADGTLRFVYDEGASFAVSQTTGTYDDGAWHLACAIFDGSNAIIDIDGGDEIVSTSATAPATAASVLAFGKLGDNNSNYFVGGLAMGGYAGSDFSATDCSNLYNSGVPQCWAGITTATQTQIDGFWYMANWSGTASQELTDQSGSDDLTNNNTVPFDGTGLTVACL